MKYNRFFILLTELFCLVILDLCGVVAFSNSGIYGSLAKELSKIIPSIYLSSFIFLVLLALGVFFVIFRNKGSAGLVVIVGLLCLPSIFSYNNLDLFKIFGASTHITTRLTLLQMISIGSLVVCAYFLLDLLQQLKLTVLRFKDNQAPPADIQDVLSHQHLLAIILTGAALLFSLIITAVARGFEYLLSLTTWPLSWWIVPVALFCITVLGIYLYWVTTRQNSTG
jgi:hypothetical protein